MFGRPLGPLDFVRTGVAKIAAACLVACAFPNPTEAAPANLNAQTKYPLEIPAGTLSDALLSLGTSLKISLFFAEETVENHKVKGLSGSYTITEALDHLTADPCLSYDFVRERLVAITPGCIAVQQSADELAVSGSRSAAEPSLKTDEPPQRVEEIVVQERYLTGSRIRQAEYGVRMPLDIIDQTEIRLSGFQDVGELLRYVPAVSGNSTSTLISNGGDGTASVTLRGLPANNTLVLLNGRRLNSDALGGQSVDLNTLPLGLVEQIEILKDGVSAIYGSDAVAGVVNIITKSDYEGLSLEAYSGAADQGDRETLNLSLTFGHTGEAFDGWYIAGGVTHYDQKGVLSRNRERSASSDDRLRGGIDKRSSATSPARIITDTGSVTLVDGENGTTVGDFRPSSAEDRFEYRDFTSSIVPSERTSAFVQAQVSLDQWEGYLDALFTRTRAENLLAPTPIFTAFEAQPIVISANQAFNPFGEEIFDLRRRVTELPARIQTNETDSYRFIIGTRYESARLNLDIALQYNQTDARETSENGIHLGRLSEALSDTCVLPCVPINLFGPAGSVTRDMLSYVGTEAVIDGTNKLAAFTIDTDWLAAELNTGPMEISAGFEYRQESLTAEPDAVLANQLLAGGGSRSAVDANRDVFEVYAEVLIPLTSRKGPAPIDLQLASRISRYSEFGYQVNPRLALSWQPTHSLTFRGSIARGFRAPSLLQLFGSTKQSFEQLNDPCSVQPNVVTFVGCEALSDATLNQFLTISGGESDLEPERSTTFSMGGIWQPEPSRHYDFSLSADWYLIEQKDVVDSSAQFVINQNARLGNFTDRVMRNEDGNISMILATLQNIGRREVSGIDISASLRWDSERLGEFTVALNTTHILYFKDKFDPDTRTIDKAGTFSDEASGGLGGLPEWKWNLAFSWTYQYWQAYYNIYRVSELREEVPLLRRERTIEAWNTHNINLSYFGPSTHWVRTTLGVSNLFDTRPPFSAAAFNDSYDGRTYDITGRYFFLNLTKQF